MNQQQTNLHTLPPLLLLLFLLLTLSTSTVFALSSDSQQPMNVEADQADIDDLKGISIYTGNVIVTQGSMVIHADKMKVYHPKKELQKIEAFGTKKKKSTYTQRPDGKPENVNAEARRMVYFADTEIVHLYTDAVLWQGGDRFTGEKIIYNTVTEKMEATSGGKSTTGKPGRVSTTIQPRSDKK